MRLEDVDEGQEQRAIEPVAIEVVRRDIGRGDQDHAILEQRREQPRQDHRVGDIVDGEFVETDDTRFGRDIARNRRDRIVLLDLALLQRLAMRGNAVMRIGHEVVEMDAPLALGGTRGKEEIHQHGLAAANMTMDIQALHGSDLRRPLGEQPAKRRGFRGETERADLLVQRIETAGERLLGGIGIEPAFGGERVVTRPDRISGV